MNKKYKAEYEKSIKFLEETYKRPLTEKEKEQVKATFDNPVAKNIELRKGEMDLRQLPKKDLIQLEDRNIRDLIAYNKFLTGEIADLCNLLCVLMIKLGIDDPVQQASDFNAKETAKIMKK